MTNPSEVDSDSLQAVKNLRSKFELLSASAASLPPSSSSSGAPQVTGNTQDDPDSIPPCLRPSSSLSDLRRRPPPPPPRSKPSPSRSPSPAPSPHASPLVRPVPTVGAVSPLLRPVPAPPIPSSLNTSFLAIPSVHSVNTNGSTSALAEGGDEESEGRSVAMLKSRFSSPAPPAPRSSSPSPISRPVPPPRPSSPNPRPVYEQPSLVAAASAKHNPLVRPVPPPTPSNSGLHNANTSPSSLPRQPPPPSSLSSPHVNASSPPLLGRHSRTPSISVSDSTSTSSSTTHTPSPTVQAGKPAIPPRPPKHDSHLSQSPPQSQLNYSLHAQLQPGKAQEGSILNAISTSPEHISPFSPISPISVDRNSVMLPDSSAPPIPARVGRPGSSAGRVGPRLMTSIGADGGGGGDSPQSASGSGGEGREGRSLFPPPPRHRASLSPGGADGPSVPSQQTGYSAASGYASAQGGSSSLPIPISKNAGAPPLPVRRGTVPHPDDRRPALQKVVAPPPLPSTSTHQPSHATLADSTSPNANKPLSRLPPPPTRTIGLGDKLPPARRPTSPSSDDESAAEEEDHRANAAELMPDSTRSNRRGPMLDYQSGSFRAESATIPKVHMHPYNGTLAMCGTWLVVGQGHALRVYDLSLGTDAPVYTVDLKDVGVKEGKITALEFCPSATANGGAGDEGECIWIGTKEGHIFVLNVRSGVVNAFKHSVHLYPITQIFRHGNSMLTLDESGKTLIFSPSNESAQLGLINTIPRVARTTEKQDFVRLLGGKLWTAARGESSSHGGHKTPIIRVFDPFNPASTGRSLIPTEHVGAVTSGTILPSHPGHVYLGHEEGFVSIWTVEDHPRCVEVVKVSLSDVLCLEGVNNRLWAGGRNGMIAAYDVVSKPWIVTNLWMAHAGVPVVRLAVDYLGVERGRLCVVSVGRDEVIRFWDGLLALDWIDKELLKSESEYSSFRDVTALIVSWNCDSARPDALSSSPDPTTHLFLSDALGSTASPDIIGFGFQEVIDLESRKMTAKNVLLGSKKKEDMGLSEKVTGAYRRWYDCLVGAVRAAWPGAPYAVVHTESLVGLFSCIFVKAGERERLRDVAVTTVKRGMGGRYGNKGGIVARFVIGDSSVCIINSHLAAGQNAVRRRNADAASILEEKTVFPVAEHPVAYVGGGDGTMVLDHEIVFFHGDMNYRIEARRDAIIAAIRAGDYTSLVPHDQLTRELKYNRAFRLRGFSEGPLTFAPTYKYDPRSNEYDTSEKHRSPAWCDRVLWRSMIPGRVKLAHYRRYEVNVSDHRPVSAAFKITVKSVQRERREEIRREVELRWVAEQERLLGLAREFYTGLGLI